MRKELDMNETESRPRHAKAIRMDKADQSASAGGSGLAQDRETTRDVLRALKRSRRGTEKELRGNIDAPWPRNEGRFASDHSSRGETPA